MPSEETSRGYKGPSHVRLIMNETITTPMASTSPGALAMETNNKHLLSIPHYRLHVLMQICNADNTSLPCSCIFSFLLIVIVVRMRMSAGSMRVSLLVQLSASLHDSLLLDLRDRVEGSLNPRKPSDPI
mmetsp:Transcript_31026/g.99519  ORF Transcript_31026/g.99519 Transcript_31026/m.99519 type:complete len:129 (+) Transcript_31026:1730-2116(+)